jgi:hypothetical protein
MKKYRWLIFSTLFIALVVIAFSVFSNKSLVGSSTANQAPQPSKDYTKDWKRYVTVQLSSGIKIGFGGFKNVTLYVANALPYNIKNLKITVKYIKANRDVYKTETVTVYNLIANGTQLVHIPDSRRGIRLDLSVTSITCPELNLYQ